MLQNIKNVVIINYIRMVFSPKLSDFISRKINQKSNPDGPAGDGEGNSRILESSSPDLLKVIVFSFKVVWKSIKNQTPTDPQGTENGTQGLSNPSRRISRILLTGSLKSNCFFFQGCLKIHQKSSPAGPAGDREGNARILESSSPDLSNPPHRIS